jgi:elongation factor Ts
MAISAMDVKTLRQRTGVGMLACKNALEEANGDIEAAIELLRKRGEMKAASKAERETNEGAIAISGKAIVKLLCETDFVARNEGFVALVEEIAAKANAEGAEAAKAYFESIKTDKMQEIGENLILEQVEILDGPIVAGYVHSNRKVAAIIALDGSDEEHARDAAMHATAMAPIVATPEEVPAELIENEERIAREELIAAGKPENIIDNIIVGKIKKFCADRALTSQAFVKNPEQTVGEYLGANVVGYVRVEV